MAIAMAAMSPLLALVGVAALLCDQAPTHLAMGQKLVTETGAIAGALDSELAGLESTLAIAAVSLSRGQPAWDLELLQTLQASLGGRDSGAMVTLREPAPQSPAAGAMAQSSVRPHLTLTGLVPGADPASARVHLLYPVPQGDDGVAMLDVSLTPAFFTATLARMAPRGQAWLIDDDSRIVASADGDPSTAGAALPQERAGHSGDLQARVGLARAAGWQVVQTRPTGADIAPDMTPLVLWGGAAALLAMLAGLGLAFLLSRRLAHPLGVLADYAGSIALASDRVLPLQPISRTREFEALRVGLLHASAVLRRRLAAERVALREARTGHDLLDSVLNATAECITVKDLDLRFVLINRAALMLGPEPLEEWQVLGRCAADICPPAVARRMEQADHAVLAEGRMTSYELSIDWPTWPQAARWLWVTTTPWRDAEGRIVGVVTVSRDVTEQRAAGFRLRGMQADLLRTTRLSAMGAMASGLAHELNQPLAAATNYLNASARLLDRDVTTRADLQAARGAVTEAAQQMLRAGAIVRRLRDFVGRGEAELQPEDVDELLRSVVDLARADGIIRGSELVLEPAAQPATVLVDRTQIQQVLLNLIRNAAEAIAVCDIGRAGEGVIRIAVNLRPSEGTAIDVIDNGPGLDPEIVERLFQPFVSTKPAGMGIGLTICHTIAEGHGGSLTVADMPGGGLRFRLSLPPVLQPDLQQAAPVGTTSGALP